LQSNLAREILGRHGRDAQLLKTVYLIDQPGKPSEKLYTKSAAAIRVLSALQGPTSILGIFLLVPAPLRDVGYDIVAAVRYRIFGKSDTCPLPKPSDRERFLDI
jgi:predicted DCC family thiol-disulfide oxidoreductase YuxK